MRAHVVTAHTSSIVERTVVSVPLLFCPRLCSSRAPREFLLLAVHFLCLPSCEEAVSATLVLDPWCLRFCQGVFSHFCVVHENIMDIMFFLRPILLCYAVYNKPS